MGLMLLLRALVDHTALCVYRTPVSAMTTNTLQVFPGHCFLIVGAGDTFRCEHPLPIVCGGNNSNNMQPVVVVVM